MFLGGVRSAADRPAISKRQIKALEKAARSKARAAARAGVPALDEAAAVAVDPEAFDWDRPLWDRQPASVD